MIFFSGEKQMHSRIWTILSSNCYLCSEKQSLFSVMHTYNYSSLLNLVFWHRVSVAFCVLSCCSLKWEQKEEAIAGFFVNIFYFCVFFVIYISLMPRANVTRSSSIKFSVMSFVFLVWIFLGKKLTKNVSKGKAIEWRRNILTLLMPTAGKDCLIHHSIYW